MSAPNQISIVSLAKIALHSKINEMRSKRARAKQDSPLANSDELVEDLPPSYYSTVSQDVDETSTKESINDYKIVIIIMFLVDIWFL